jgi:uncharacterized protein DUF5672
MATRMPIQLPDVTLCCIDTRDPARAAWALQRCMAQIQFGEVLLFSQASLVPAPPAGVRIIDVCVETIEAYSQFMLRGLAQHVRTSHLLVAQWDGFVRDAACWDESFLGFDYIGAPWRDAPPQRAVGNGGFSLRSRRLLHALLDPDVTVTHPEDESICVVNRALLESRHGVRIAPLEVARRFSYERIEPPAPTFGFHGLFNFPRELSKTEVTDIVLSLPDRLMRGLDAHDLCAMLIRSGQLDTARILLDKRWRLGMRDRRTLRLAWRLRMARWRAAGRAAQRTPSP